MANICALFPEFLRLPELGQFRGLPPHIGQPFADRVGTRMSAGKTPDPVFRRHGPIDRQFATSCMPKRETACAKFSKALIRAHVGGHEPPPSITGKASRCPAIWVRWPAFIEKNLSPHRTVLNRSPWQKQGQKAKHQGSWDAQTGAGNPKQKAERTTAWINGPRGLNRGS